jgi:chemotaxis family two-component system sensor kinase Cph1
MECTPQHEPTFRQPAIQLQGRRILVVEDEGLIAMFVQDALESAGATVIGPVGRLKPALIKAEADAIDAALLDVDLDGELCWPIADVLAGRGIPFALTTGFTAGLGMPERFAGADIVLKPYLHESVLTTLAKLLRGNMSEVRDS